MPIIIPSGLLRGERMAKLSDHAKLYWAYFYAGSNGYGRLLLDYQWILSHCFAQFNEKPTRDTVISLLKEFREVNLLFVYQSQDAMWGAWDSTAKQKYHSKEDKASPAPPEEEFELWVANYKHTKEKSKQKETDSLAADFADETDSSEGNFQPSPEKNEIHPANLNISPGYTSTTTSDINASTIHQTTKTSSATITPPLKGTEGWNELVDAATHAGMSLDPSPHSDLCRKTWCWLDMAVKLSAISGIRERIACGQYGPSCDPGMVPRLATYMREKRWTESLRPPAKRATSITTGDKFAHLRKLADSELAKGRAS